MRNTCFHTGRKLSVAAILAALSVGYAPGESSAQSQPYPRMAPLEQYLTADRAAEIALARSAAPTAISSAATVLVLTRGGYETAARGTNGFVCLVDRAWQAPFAEPEFWNPKIRAPVCLNPQAARSVLPLQQKRTEWALAGLSKDEILARLEAAIAEKGAPLEIGAMSYMMSRNQYLSDDDRHWHPHLMFYTPNTVAGGDWGANLRHSPVLGGGIPLPGGGLEPVIIYLVPVSRWSDGTPEVAH